MSIISDDATAGVDGNDDLGFDICEQTGETLGSAFTSSDDGLARGDGSTADSLGYRGCAHEAWVADEWPRIRV